MLRVPDLNFCVACTMGTVGAPATAFPSAVRIDRTAVRRRPRRHWISPCHSLPSGTGVVSSATTARMSRPTSSALGRSRGP